MLYCVFLNDCLAMGSLMGGKCHGPGDSQFVRIKLRRRGMHTLRKAAERGCGSESAKSGSPCSASATLQVQVIYLIFLNLAGTWVIWVHLESLILLNNILLILTRLHTSSGHTAGVAAAGRQEPRPSAKRGSAWQTRQNSRGCVPRTSRDPLHIALHPLHLATGHLITCTDIFT